MTICLPRKASLTLTIQIRDQIIREEGDHVSVGATADTVADAAVDADANASVQQRDDRAGDIRHIVDARGHHRPA